MVSSTSRILEQEVPEALEARLAAAKKATPSPEQQEEQRRSFAYGNTAFENNLITREMIDRQADAIERKRNEQRSR
jgi:hypothetical protein